MKFLFPLLLFLIANLSKGEGLDGKVMCGYQGWFRTPEDGYDTGWSHYGGRIFAPGSCGIDLWPDVRELPESARVKTAFQHKDGTAAEVYSSTNPAAITKHFEWMRDYGIDGIFLQRFAVTTKDAKYRRSLDDVLVNCRKAAADTGRNWVLMYDLSGLRSGDTQVVIEDWKRLRALYKIADSTDRAYLQHRSKPLVALWGLGFNDRPPMLAEWKELVRFFKEDAGCSVMLGVPAYWRTLDRDSIPDPLLHDVIKRADVVSPWTVGRYGKPRDVTSYMRNAVKDDLIWCTQNHLDYLPVAFPGFSWHNLQAWRSKSALTDQVPRLGGRFLWSQATQYHDAGAKALYVAMFDELDEGTAIYKVRNDPPIGSSPFVSEPDVPGDRYLKLTGLAGKLFKGQEIRTMDGLPAE
ncbi:MAG: glycoside hydrolase family 71/99-like protein [Luteolibacter sp.]